MREPAVARAKDAAMAVAGAAGLAVDDAVVLQNSNKVALRLLPSDVFARVAVAGDEVFAFELDLAQRLAATGSPAAALDPRVEPRVHERDGFVVTLWTYYEPVAHSVSPADYARALARLHDGLRQVALDAPHFTERVAEAQHLVADPELTPDLAVDERSLVSCALQTATDAILERGHTEQLLHGEPHRGNVLATADGPRFIDFETCCRGPIEFDLAHAPDEVTAYARGFDADLLQDSRRLVLAMIAAWRYDAHDQFPDGERSRPALLAALRSGPPWPTADAAAGPAGQ